MISYPITAWTASSRAGSSFIRTFFGSVSLALVALCASPLGHAASVVLEAENLPRISLGAPTRNVADSHASGGSVLFLDASTVGNALVLTTPVIPDNRYSVQLRYKSNTTRSNIQVTIDDSAFSASLDEFGPVGYQTVMLGGPGSDAVFLTGHRSHTIRFEVTRKDDASSGYIVTVDSITFVPRTDFSPSVQIVNSEPTITNGFVSSYNATLLPFPEDATVRYTLDGSLPTATHGLIYTSPIFVNKAATLSAFAFKAGLPTTDGFGVVTRPYAFDHIPFMTYVVTPRRQSVAMGDSADYAISIKAYNGFNAPVTFGTIGLEATATAKFSPPTITGTGSSTLTFTSVPFNLSQVNKFLDQPINVSAFAGGVQRGQANLNFKIYALNPGEAEKLPRSSSGATTTVRPDPYASGFKWVSLDALGTAAFAEFTLQSVPSGRYQIKLAYRADNNHGTLQLAVDGVSLGSPLDQYSSAPAFLENSFGILFFNSTATHRIRLTVTGKNAASLGFMLSADRIILSPVP